MGEPGTCLRHYPARLLWAMALLSVLLTLSPYRAEAIENNAAVDETGRALPVLRGGWYLWDPYQFVESRDGNRKLTGMDVDFTRAAARAAGFEVDYAYRPWHQHIAQLRNGEADIATGATWTAERATFMHFSKPYRQETNVLYLPRGMAPRYPFSDTEGMLQMVRSSGFRLGVISGYAFADPAITAYVADPANAARITFADNDYDNFRNLMSGRIDGFIADRLVAATTAWRGGWRDKVEEHPIRITVDIHLVFSKATVPVETVHRFDQAIQNLQNNGEAQRIFGNYIAPLLLAQAIDRSWFTLLDVIGTIAFALSGVLIAARERYSLLGALILAALPAVGGGVIRDLLVGRETLAVFASPLYLGLVGSTVLAGFTVLRLIRLASARNWLPRAFATLGGARTMRNLFEVSDAIGIAAFTVTGVAVAISHKAEPVWLWAPLLAMLTAAGGGILRDVLRQSGDIKSLRSEFYAEVPIIWGLLLALYLHWQALHLGPDDFVTAVVVTMAGAFLTRMAAVTLKMKSPAFA